MEIQLEELIEQIKKDGVEKAQKEASEIIKAAKDEAEKITEKAKTDADKIMENAKEECQRFVLSSEESLRQAGRNLLLSFRESVQRELRAVIGENVSEIYSKEALCSVILETVTAWSKNSDADSLSLLLNQKDLDIIEAQLLSALKEKAMQGVTLISNDSFDGGFRISKGNENVYYDYSKDAVVDMLSLYLNPRITALMKEAEK